MSSKSSNVLIIGHRGANKIAPENTLKSFQKSIDLKADYLEFDVHQSKDGEIVVIHDSKTKRTTGYKGEVKAMTLAELKALDAGEGEKIPTLDELLQMAKGKIGIQLEIKAPGMAQKIVDMLRSLGLIESTLISSLNHNELIKIQKIEPKIKLAALLIGLKKKKVLLECIDKGFEYIHPYYRFINEKFINTAHEHDIKVNAWTVNTQPSMKKVIAMGIDGIITNDIELAKEVLNRI